jgi:hypothetical protein
LVADNITNKDKEGYLVKNKTWLYYQRQLL